MAKVVNRKLNSPTEEGDGRKKKQTAAPKTPKPAASKPAEKSEADKKFDAERAKHKRNKNKKKSQSQLEAALKRRMAVYSNGIKKAKKSQATLRTLLAAKQKTTRVNLGIKQKAAVTNLKAKQKARMEQRLARKPVIKGDNVVTPKARKIKVKLVKPKLHPIPHLKDGKIVTTKRKPVQHDPARRAAAKEAAKTKKRGTVEV